MNKNLIRTVRKNYTLTGCLAVSRRGLLYPDQQMSWPLELTTTSLLAGIQIKVIEEFHNHLLVFILTFDDMIQYVNKIQ